MDQRKFIMNIEEKLGDIFRRIDNFTMYHNIEDYKRYLTSIDVEEHSTDVLVGILSASYATAHLVEEVRSDLFNRIHKKLAASDIPKKEVYEILQGLDDNNDWLIFTKMIKGV